MDELEASLEAAAAAAKRARRLLELAALLTSVAILILVIDFSIKQSIIKRAHEATRAHDAAEAARRRQLEAERAIDEAAKRPRRVARAGTDGVRALADAPADDPEPAHLPS